ncbi:MAG TPA: DUF6049 family protein [Acidimicrobiales bacterium]|nr:DUF6049 family protein [Acidimicrobiales bacterium]
MTGKFMALRLRLPGYRRLQGGQGLHGRQGSEGRRRSRASMRRRTAHFVAAGSLVVTSAGVAGAGVATGAADRVAAEPLVVGKPGGSASNGTTLKRKPPAPDIATGPDRLQLLSQTVWVGPSSTQFQLHVRITAKSPVAEMLAVNVYPGLTTRTQFQAALGGELYGSYYQPGGGPLPLTTLPRDPGGGVDIDIPVNQPTGELSGTGVYPVHVFLENDGVPVGNSLTTFIVYAGKDLSPFRLDTSFVLPMTSAVPIGPTGTPGSLSAGDAATLQGDAAAIAMWHVPVTVRAATPTLESLATGSPSERTAVVDLRDALASGDELLPATALPVDIPALVGSGLTADLSTQLTSGNADLDRLLGVEPALNDWASDGDIDPTSMSVLANLGISEVAVPETDLSTLPLADQVFTFAQPTKLSLPGAEIAAVGADTELSGRVAEAAAPGTAVLVANQFLAELAMIDLERPSDQRGVVIIPPPGVQVDPVFLSVLLAGLHGNPLVQGVDLAQLFKDVPPAPSAGGGPLVRQLSASSGPGAELQGAEQLRQAVADVSAAGEVYGALVPLVKGLDQKLFVSLSSTFDGAQRASIIAGVVRSADSALGDVHLPSSVSITLTSRQGRLPLALVSTATSPVRVRLVLTSQQLSFVATAFTEGSCAPVNAAKSTEHCQLTLSRATTVLRIPVVVRTPGAFPLSLRIETPSGDEVLRSGSGTVTSTAISDVGWFLMVGAALFLVVWWVRNARHGRRARQLVPRPEDERGAVDPGSVAPDGVMERQGATTPAGASPAPASPAPASPGPASPGPASEGAPGAPGEPSPAGATVASPNPATPADPATAANPAGPAGRFAVSSARDGYLAKHVLRPPR